MAYSTPELQAGTIVYSLRVDHVDGSFMAQIQGSAIENGDTGAIDEAAADDAFQQLLDALGELTDFTVTKSQKQFAMGQSATITPAP